MIKRRGLSSVIGVALITLGTIIGVSLLWAFVSRNVDDARNEVTDPDCLTINLEVVSCNAFNACSYMHGNNYYEADMVVRRNVGKGNITALRFIFDDPNGISGIADRDINSVNLGELGSVRFAEPYGGVPIPVYPWLVKVAALIGPKKEVCPITSTAVSCPILSQSLPLGNVANSTYSGIPSEFVYNRRMDSCCQHPLNRSQCYLGGDPNYPFNSQGLLINATTGLPSTILPPGNTSICCQYNPENGGPVVIIE